MSTDLETKRAQCRERNRRWRERHGAEHRETARINVARWRAENPESQAAINKRYYEANKDKFLQKDIARRRLLAGTVNDFTTEQWGMLKRLCDYRCGYCGEKKPLERDHVIPVSKGGAHTLGNIIPACRPCNRSKSDLLEWD